MDRVSDNYLMDADVPAVAGGGNALADPARSGTIHLEVIQKFAADIAPVFGDRNNSKGGIVVHGNGPQVGEYIEANPGADFYEAIADTQSSIGIPLISALSDYFDGKRVVAFHPTVATVWRGDPALMQKVKGIGKQGPQRRKVSSPEQRNILDVNTIRSHVKYNHIVVCGGGGGVLVFDDDHNDYVPDAVGDKDIGAGLIAKSVGADVLLILTNVDGYRRDFGTDKESTVPWVTPGFIKDMNGDARLAGSMGPKLIAAQRFVDSGNGRVAVIGNLKNAAALIRGDIDAWMASTVVLKDAPSYVGAWV